MTAPIGRLFWEGSDFGEESDKFTSNLLAIDRDNNQTKFSIKVDPKAVIAKESHIKELCEAIRTRGWVKGDYPEKELRVYHSGGMFDVTDIEYYRITLSVSGILAFGRIVYFKWAPNESINTSNEVDLSDCDDGELERIAIRLRNALKDPREAAEASDASSAGLPPTEPLTFDAPSQEWP